MLKSSDKIVVEIGEKRKNAFKSKLYAEGKRIKDFIIGVIDKYLESEGKNEFN